MANCQTRKDVYKDAEEQRSKKESTRKKLDKIEVSSNKPLSNDKLKKKEQEQFPIKDSLLETSKVALNIVEITQDSTLYSQNSSSNDLLNEYSMILSSLSGTKCNTAVGTSTGSEKSGPFSAIKENIMKKQKDSINFDEFVDVLPS